VRARRRRRAPHGRISFLFITAWCMTHFFLATSKLQLSYNAAVLLPGCKISFCCVFSVFAREKEKKAVCKNENNQLSASFVAAALDTLVAATPLPAAPTSEDPDFRHPIKNVTVPVGREAILACQVTDLGHYKVNLHICLFYIGLVDKRFC
jgi:hypothetical protein